MHDKKYVGSKEAALQGGQRGLLGTTGKQDDSAAGHLREEIRLRDVSRHSSEHVWATDMSDWSCAVPDHGMQSVASRRSALNGTGATMPVKLGFMGAFQSFLVTGGPYEDFRGRDKAYGVCLGAESELQPEGFDAYLPIVDFRVPVSLEATRRTLVLTLKAALEGQSVYVGCRGGGNRMELFLALLGKVTGQSGWVSHLRTYGAEQSTATDEQRCYVRDFEEQELTAWLYRQAWLAAWDKAVGKRSVFRRVCI
jgi:hypothetical protein